MKDIKEILKEGKTDNMEATTDKVVVNGKAVKKDPEKMAGKDEEENGSNGTFAIDPPTEEDVALRYQKEGLSKNEKKVRMRMAAKQDFFIMGHAGWGKTQIIRKMAKRYGRTVITVYLDKAVKEDLGGIPVPVKKGLLFRHSAIELAMPAWAAYMLEHPDTQFLLFMDEMNQADPGVQNALMPIIDEKVICNVKFDNYIVGAAGNYADENRAVTDLSAPLKSRFGGIILWEDNTPETWAETFKYLHKGWDNVLGKDFVDVFEKHAGLFNSPREVEKKIFGYVKNLKEEGITDDFDAEDYLSELRLVSKDDIDERSKEKDLEEIAEYIYSYMTAGAEANKPKERTKGRMQISQHVINTFRFGMPAGYIDFKGHDYLFTREGCYWLTADVNAEQIDHLIEMLESEDIHFKYETDAEAKKDPALKHCDPIPR